MILITGATGFLGTHLLFQLLQQQKPIRALYLNENKKNQVITFLNQKNNNLNWNLVEWFQTDILSIPKLTEAFQNIDEVYHCAAMVSFQPKDYKQLYKVNVIGTANMVNFSLDFGIKKFCYVSSMAALGNGTEQNPVVNEETDRNPEIYCSDYSRSKYAAELEVWRGYQEGLPVFIVNPGVIFGDYFTENGSTIFKTIVKKFPFVTQGKLGIVAVEDVVAIMLKGMENQVFGERFTLVAEDLTYQALFNTLADGLQLPKPKFHLRPFVANTLYKFDYFISLITRKNRHFTRATAQSLFNMDVHQTDKVKNQFNFTFTPMKPYLIEWVKN